ncbi:MAG: autotransporter domain-containing protein, partial [Planctomycetia bacterium]|nr:autotransporter domain-containing protein [Planctomycetia bacterium]
PIIYTAHRVDSSTPKFWNVRGNDGGRDWANVGIGVDFNLTQRLSVLADYNVFVNEYTTLHTGMASLRFEF